jgi:hypothetical protein
MRKSAFFLDSPEKLSFFLILFADLPTCPSSWQGIHDLLSLWKKNHRISFVPDELLDEGTKNDNTYIAIFLQFYCTAT